MMLTPYSKEVEEQMQELYSRLSEKDRRLYAGIEALKLPYGGVSYISLLFNCSRDTIHRGIKELGEAETLPKDRDRKTGGGRKQVFEKRTDIQEVFQSILKEHTAGDPMDEKVKWTDLTRAEIAALLAAKGFKVSRNIVAKLLKNTVMSNVKP